MSNKKAIIIGAGPAGLTAAYELLQKTDIKPVIFEKTNMVGGIARTVNYRGNRIDIGGHRFFSKSDTIMQWWKNIFDVVDTPDDIAKNETFSIESDDVFLIRDRLSRIYYDGKFFDYPVTLSWDTLSKLGPVKIIKIFFSYLKVTLFPVKNIDNLEDFFINRFGRELYETFFKEYTEKVWGKFCQELSADWGAQRIKDLSVTKVIIHYFKQFFQSDDESVEQKDTETSLIEQFLYPKYGPGQFWEKIADIISEKGGEIHYQNEVSKVIATENDIEEVIVEDKNSNQNICIDPDYVISSMPVRDLISSLESVEVPKRVRNITEQLEYRSFLTVGLLLDKLDLENKTDIETKYGLVPDNWIYVQEKNVKVGRLQIFNNWSPFMVSDPEKVWLGLEYFCDENDEFWNRSDKELREFAADELVEMNMIKKDYVEDSVVINSAKTYPVYNQAYKNFDIIKNYIDQFKNLFLIGRNGMHRYNNMDHSMLAAIEAVKNIKNNKTDKSNIWNVNTEDEYHEKE